MNRRRLPFSLLFLLLIQTLPSSVIAIFTNNNTYVLQDVIKEISERHNWDLERIKYSSKLKVSKIRFGTAHRYEFRIRFGKMPMIVKFPDEVDSWRTIFNKGNNDFGDFVKEIGSTAVLDTFKVEGPFDLWVGGHDQLSLSLPLNVSCSSLKRILVGEGITLEIRKAKGISVLQTFDPSSNAKASVQFTNGKAGFYSIWHHLCMPLLPMHVIGSASLVAYTTRNPDAPVLTNLLSKRTIELLPEKCYGNNWHKNQARISHSLSLKIDRLGKLMSMLLRNKTGQNWLSGFIRANVKAAAIIQFQLEVERNITTLRGAHEHWRTRSTAEKVWFEVLARVEDEKLRPLTVKKVRPFIAVDSTSWSNLMSNISFTKFPSILVPSEALTLDVKW